MKLTNLLGQTSHDLQLAPVSPRTAFSSLINLNDIGALSHIKQERVNDFELENDHLLSRLLSLLCDWSRSCIDRHRKHPGKEESGSAFVFGKPRVAGETPIFSQHVARKKTKHPRPEHGERNPVHGHNRERNVDEDFAQIVRIPGSGEQPILDQALSFPQHVELLGITDVVKKDSGDVQEQDDSEDVRRQSHASADKQIRSQIVTRQGYEYEPKADLQRNSFGKASVGEVSLFQQPQEGVGAV
jgi:hypothetical protein